MEEKCCSCNCSQKCQGELTQIRTTNSILTWKNHLDHILARFGFRRMSYIVKPGIYTLGNPNSESPVFVSANYTLSFDALRSSLRGIDAYILVIDTKGINVWCAAGKGTFGTDELVNRIKITGLDKIVIHRKLIVPQLGAPGVSAHEMVKRSGFSVEYGPIRACDLPEYLKNYTATVEMRKVTFPLLERIKLIPVELMGILPYLIVSVLIFGFLVSWDLALRIIIAVLAGNVLFPILLPYIPTKDFSIKGLLLGWFIFIPLAILTFMNSEFTILLKLGMVLAEILIFPAIVSWFALMFTGSTPFASRSGVRTEIYRYTHSLVGMFFGGIIIAIVNGLFIGGVFI